MALNRPRHSLPWGPGEGVLPFRFGAPSRGVCPGAPPRRALPRAARWVGTALAVASSCGGGRALRPPRDRLFPHPPARRLPPGRLLPRLVRSGDGVPASGRWPCPPVARPLAWPGDGAPAAARRVCPLRLLDGPRAHPPASRLPWATAPRSPARCPRRGTHQGASPAAQRWRLGRAGKRAMAYESPRPVGRTTAPPSQGVPAGTTPWAGGWEVPSRSGGTGHANRGASNGAPPREQS